MATTLTLEPSALLDAPSPLSALLDTPAAPPALPETTAALPLPGQITLSSGPSALVAAPQSLPLAFPSTRSREYIVRRQRARWGERLFHGSVCGLMFLSGGVALYRLLWMGQ